MIPARVYYTGMDFDPIAVMDRWHRGVIPLEWHRHSFNVRYDIWHPVTALCLWLNSNIEGRWSIWTRFAKANTREVTIAFENDFDGVTFVMADGQHEAFDKPEQVF